MSRMPISAASTALGAVLFLGCADQTPTGLEGPDPSQVLTSESAEATTFSGRATVVDATVLGVATVLGDTGPLPESGGAIENSILEVAVPDLLTARVGHASSVGQGNRAYSASSVADLDLTVAGSSISANFLGAEARAVCNKDGTVSLEGKSHVARLTVNGAAIEVTGEPNQRVDLPAGYIIINEQTRERDGEYGAITVTALHVVVPGTADVVIASAHADIRCEPTHVCSREGDFVTGGGWITAPDGGRGTFGAGGGIKHGSFWGHLVYHDHGAKLRIKGTSVTDYEVIGPTTRRFAGTAEIDGTPGDFEVIVSDNHDGGRGSDTFEIRAEAPGEPPYFAHGVLQGGNIQLHEKPCQ